MNGTLRLLPFASRVLLGTCIGVWLVGSVGLSGNQLMCLRASALLAGPWRLILSAFAHTGLLHIVMNSMSIVSLAHGFETKYGTVNSLWAFLIFLPAFVGATLALLGVAGESLASMLSPSAGAYILKYFSMSGCAVGYSGVLFALLTIDVSSAGGNERNLCGWRVPARMFPWVLLAGIQLLFPGVSLAGHAAGIFVGYAFCAGATGLLSSNITASIERLLSGGACGRFTVEQDCWLASSSLGSSSNRQADPAEFRNVFGRAAEATSAIWNSIRSRFAQNSPSASGDIEAARSFPSQGYRLGTT